MRARGFDTLARSARAAADELADVSTDQAAAIVAAAARARAPRRSGALAASVGAANGVVTVGAIYGGVLEGGWRAHNIEPQPFVSPAVAATERARTAAVEADVQRALDKVTGA